LWVVFGFLMPNFRSLEFSSGLLEIIRFRVSNHRLRSFRQFNVDALPNPEAWMAQYSRLWGGTPEPGFQYIQRGTAIGVEHFFDQSVFPHLKFE
jgi:hypothetical protein